MSLHPSGCLRRLGAAGFAVHRERLETACCWIDPPVTIAQDRKMCFELCATNSRYIVRQLAGSRSGAVTTARLTADGYVVHEERFSLTGVLQSPSSRLVGIPGWLLGHRETRQPPGLSGYCSLSRNTGQPTWLGNTWALPIVHLVAPSNLSALADSYETQFVKRCAIIK